MLTPTVAAALRVAGFRPGGRRALAALLCAAAFALPACAGSHGAGQPAAVSGTVLAVEGVSVTQLRSLDILDADGALWHFEAAGFAGMTPSHLEEHRVFGQPVRVAYEERDGRLVITMITDG